MTQSPLAGTIGAQGGTSALLLGLEEATEQHIENLKGPKTAAEELDNKIAEIQQQIEQANKTQNRALRDDRLRILTSTLEDLRKEDASERQDFAEAVMGLDVLMNSIGGDFAKLMEPSESEKAILRSAKGEVATAEEELIVAQGKMSLFGIRERAVRAAQAKLEQVKAQAAEAEVRVKKMARDRLMSADIEESMQQYRKMVDQTIKIMQARHKITAGQLKIVTARKAEAFKIKEQAAQALERLDQELNGLESDLQAAEELKSTMINGAPDFVAQEQKVSNLKTRVEEVRGNRNTAHTIFLSKERYSSELEIHEIATRKTFDTQKIWIAKATSDAEERQVTFISRVEQMKAMADFDVIQNQDAVGARIDLSNASYMATSSSIADRARMDMLESHPDQIRALEAIRSAQAEAISLIRDREGAMIDEFKARWGIDPFAGSTHRFGSSDAEEASTPQAAV